MGQTMRKLRRDEDHDGHTVDDLAQIHHDRHAGLYPDSTPEERRGLFKGIEAARSGYVTVAKEPATVRRNHRRRPRPRAARARRTVASTGPPGDDDGGGDDPDPDGPSQQRHSVDRSTPALAVEQKGLPSRSPSVTIFRGADNTHKRRSRADNAVFSCPRLVGSPTNKRPQGNKLGRSLLCLLSAPGTRSFIWRARRDRPLVATAARAGP